MKRVKINTDPAYEVLIGPELLKTAGAEIRRVCPNAQKIVVVTDHTVEKLWSKALTLSLSSQNFQTIGCGMTPGEAAKNPTAYLGLLSGFAHFGVTRTDAIVALGGGVIGDLAGFAAATYLRGVPFIQVPTTLLAMVDSSVGGKTGIDLKEGKNLVGAFHQPHLVLCDTDTLKTLPSVVVADGMAEVVKYGMIGDGELLDSLSSPEMNFQTLIMRSVQQKRDFVERDERDIGQRQLLNFGHTIGHAIEQASGFMVTHGKAVSIGMVMETRAAVARGKCSWLVLDRLLTILDKLGLPTETEFTANVLAQVALRDKKRSGNNLYIPTPYDWGYCKLDVMPVSELKTWIEQGGSKA